MSDSIRVILTMLLVAAFLVGAKSAEAHPHLFARYKVVLTPADAGYINLHFTFKAYSAANPLRIPDTQSGDAPLLTNDMLGNFQEHPFFLYLDFDGKAQGQQQVELVAENSADRDPAYSFDRILPDTLKNFGIALYDSSYFDFVSLDGADSVIVKVNGLSCAVQSQDVGKTVWGVLHAQYVQYGDGAGHRLTPPHIIQMPEAFTPSGAETFKNHNFMP